MPVAAAAEQARPIKVRRMDRTDRATATGSTAGSGPQYRDAPVEAPAGEYWTPVPESSLAGDDPEPSAKGYGWPVPVERLPAVPATASHRVRPGPARRRADRGGPDLAAAVRPSRRIRLPRSWATRNERHNASDERQGRTAERYDASAERPDAHGEVPAFDDRVRRANGFDPLTACRRHRGSAPAASGPASLPGIPAEGPGREPGARMLSAADQPGRPRPRPRPRPGPAERADRSTVYVESACRRSTPGCRGADGLGSVGWSRRTPISTGLRFPREPDPRPGHSRRALVADRRARRDRLDQRRRRRGRPSRRAGGPGRRGRAAVGRARPQGAAVGLAAARRAHPQRAAAAGPGTR